MAIMQPSLEYGFSAFGIQACSKLKLYNHCSFKHVKNMSLYDSGFENLQHNFKLHKYTELKEFEEHLKYVHG